MTVENVGCCAQQQNEATQQRFLSHLLLLMEKMATMLATAPTIQTPRQEHSQIGEQRACVEVQEAEECGTREKAEESAAVMALLPSTKQTQTQTRPISALGEKSSDTMTTTTTTTTTMVDPNAPSRRSGRNHNSIRLSGGFCPSFYRKLDALFFNDASLSPSKASAVVRRGRTARAKMAKSNGKRDKSKAARLASSARLAQSAKRAAAATASTRLSMLPSSTVEKVHDEPSIYVIDNFLTPSELEFFDRVITSCKFEKSFVDNMEFGTKDDSTNKDEDKPRQIDVDNDKNKSSNDNHDDDVNNIEDASTQQASQSSVSPTNGDHPVQSPAAISTTTGISSDAIVVRNDEDGADSPPTATQSQTSTEALQDASSSLPLLPSSSSEQPPAKKQCRKKRQSRTIVDTLHRTSTFFAFRKLHNQKIASLEQRIASMLGCWVHQIEALQLVRYLPGQFFGVHHDMGDLLDDGDVVLPPKHLAVKRRLVTVFVYLNTLEEGQGGCTYFPRCGGPASKKKRQQQQNQQNQRTAKDVKEPQKDPAMTPTRCSARIRDRKKKKQEHEEEEAKKERDAATNKPSEGGASKTRSPAEDGLRIHPKRGRAVLWSNVTKGGLPDPFTVHAGEPVIQADVPSSPPPNGAGTNSTSTNAPTANKNPTTIKYGLNIWICEE
mmetsp:Transcript_17490/g.49407  ORF Transcript_17490/g.49407 Transcript_17490/m.49407 type:complete len:665 (+) Transcript_17490:3-1997(+)